MSARRPPSRPSRHWPSSLATTGTNPSRDEVEAAILAAEYSRTVERRATRRRRLRKFGLVLIVPIAGPLAGDLWAEQEAKGWR